MSSRTADKIIHDALATDFVSSSGPKVTVQIGDQGPQYKLPKNVLRQQSHYFKAILNDPLQESNTQTTILQEFEGNVSVASFGLLVQWMFVGMVIFPSLDTPEEEVSLAIEFARLADMCGVAGTEPTAVWQIKRAILRHPASTPQTFHSFGALRDKDSNTYCLTPEHLELAAELPENHPVRKILADASIEGYIRRSGPSKAKFWNEMLTIPSYGVDVLRQTHEALRTVRIIFLEGNKVLFQDPITGIDSPPESKDPQIYNRMSSNPKKQTGQKEAGELPSSIAIRDFATSNPPESKDPRITFIIGKSGRKYTVSKRILVANSKYFSRMSDEGQLEEGREGTKLDDIDGVLSQPSFEMLLRYIYTGKTKVPAGLAADQKISLLLELVRLGEMCAVTGLVQMDKFAAYKIRQIILENPGPKDNRHHFDRSPDTNTFCISSQHIASAMVLPKGHPVRRVLVSATVEGYIRGRTPKFAREITEIDGFAADLLAQVKRTLLNGRTILGSEGVFQFTDPLSDTLVYHS
ncbi:hypothetical protein G7Y89_g10550 [Cudoniella acicularis]|uniref:BTB domain-containing protein n=1 Tax=Cudoniella acicularis TaxID=354080 RepID=A0A8H4REV4_9HELO|nr:hypothetical protein G7Y89_g10550 [Cudoniella acicularis]